jgi:hypothetical protein
MAGYGVIIDIDHLSRRSKIDISGEKGLGSSVSARFESCRFSEISNGDQSNEDQLSREMVDDLIKWGGAFAPILHQGRSTLDIDTYPPDTTVSPQKCGGTTEGFLQTYRYIVDRLKKGKRAFGSEPYVGVGYGSDFNGLAGWPAPRFDTAGTVTSEFDPAGALTGAFIGGSSVGPSGRCYLALGSYPAEAGHVSCPFTWPNRTPNSPQPTITSFGQSSLPWSGRPSAYDVSSDGVAHVGMIADFVEELKALGLSEEDLDPLWHGAEAYIRTWEEASTWSGTYNNESQRGVRDICRAARADLVSTDYIDKVVIAKWRTALDTLRTNGCKGA